MNQSFLYLLPEEIRVKELAEAITCCKKEQVEVWTDMNLLEISLENGSLVFEDIMDNLRGESDAALLSSMQISQVYACDYVSEDVSMVQKIMGELKGKFQGILASDTEDFKPFLELEEL